MRCRRPADLCGAQAVIGPEPEEGSAEADVTYW
jgi:hypothetical protein